jgi:calcineurin-like phosphoesterase family protein
MNNNQKIFFSSDIHFGHKNICKGVSTWEDKSGCRDFDSVEKMNETIINNINEKVGKDDILYFLGDWSFGNIANIWNFRKRIYCRNIEFTIGNHDQAIEENKLLPNCIRTSAKNGGDIIDGDIEQEKEEDYSWYELTTNEVFAKNIFSSVQHYKEINVGKQKICMSHYAQRVWNKHHRGAIHLYGHSHSSLEQLPWGKSMDVGIDNAFKLYGEYVPFSLTDILDIMGKREIKIIDHHE